MSKSAISLSNFFSRLCNISSRYNKSIIVLIGDFGTSIFIFNNDNIIDSLFVDKNHHNDFMQYDSLLSRYKGYYLFLLVDSADSKIYHEILPVVQNVLKTSPVQQFINHNIKDTYSVAHDIVDISKIDGENWFTIFSLIPLTDNLKEWICRSTEYKIQFAGLYHLQLEFFHILKNFLLDTNYSLNITNSVQIAIIPTKSFGIFVFVRNNKHLMDSYSVEIPQDKSDEYLQGVIENEINNCLLEFKQYIQTNKMEVNCVLFVKENMKNSFSNYKDKLNELTIISLSELYSKYPKISGYEDNNMTDRLIAQIFSTEKKHLSFNQKTNSIKILGGAYNLLTRTFQAGLMFLLSVIAININNIWMHTQQVTILNQELVSLVNQYNDIKSNYQDQNNLNKVLDYIALNKIIYDQNITNPDNIINTIINNPHSQSAIIQRITWSNNKNYLLGDGDQECNIYIKYFTQDVTPSTILKIVEEYVNYIKQELPDYNVVYILDKQRLLTLSNISSIYLQIKISKIVS